MGLQEVISYSLIDEIKNKGFINAKQNIKIQNPMGEDKSILRYNLLPSLINIYNYNKARNINNINIFEIASTYYKEGKNYIEEEKVAGILSDKYLYNYHLNQEVEINYYLVKGMLEQLLNYLGLENRYEFKEMKDKLKEMHPGISSDIYIDDEVVGFLGKINPKLNIPIYVFEISLDKIYKKHINKIKYADIPKYPSIIKDIAFEMPKTMNSNEIIKRIEQENIKTLEHIEVIDVYEGDNIDANQKSITYSLTFNNKQRTLKDEEVLKEIDNIVEIIEKQKDIKLRI